MDNEVIDLIDSSSSDSNQYFDGGVIDLTEIPAQLIQTQRNNDKDKHITIIDLGGSQGTTDDLIGSAKVVHSIGREGSEGVVDLFGPEESVDLVGPMETVDLVGPEETDDLVGREEPVYLIGPGEPVDLIGREEPVNLIGREEQVDLIGPEEPVELIGPEEPVELIGPEEPVELIGPEEPVDLISPEEPVDLIGPEEPVDLIGPEEPVVDFMGSEGSEGIVDLIGRETITTGFLKSGAPSTSNEDVIDLIEPSSERVSLNLGASPSKPSTYHVTNVSSLVGLADSNKKPIPCNPLWNKNERALAQLNADLNLEIDKAMRNFRPEQRFIIMQVISMFPHADPLWVLSQPSLITDANSLIERMTSDPKSYPSKRSRQTLILNNKRRKVLLDPSQFDVQEYLKMFEDPFKSFADISKPVSQLYKDHVMVAVNNEPSLKSISEGRVEHYAIKNNYHVYPMIKAMQLELINQAPPHKRAKYDNPLKIDKPWPEKIDEMFFKELQCIIFENEIRTFQAVELAIREEQVEIATKNGTLIECVCCCDEVLQNELIHCSNVDHQFCFNCIKEHAKVKIGEGKHEVICISDGCKQVYSPSTLRKFISPLLMNLLLNRNQKEQIRKAGYENMVSCPFCEFCVILDNPEEKVLRCLNVECCKESCLECSEESHIPLKCSEVEKEGETAMRTFIENKMAEAMIRKCPKCRNRTIKMTGCNHMTCPCGTHYCYECGKEMSRTNPYSHFSKGSGSGCRATNNDYSLHEVRAKLAGEAARKEYLAKHPQMANNSKVQVEKLVHVDPKKIQIRQNPLRPPRPNPYLRAGVTPRARRGGRPRANPQQRIRDPDEPPEEMEWMYDPFMYRGRGRGRRGVHL